MFRVFRASELEHSNLKKKGGKSLSLRNKTFPFGNSYSSGLCTTFLFILGVLSLLLGFWSFSNFLFSVFRGEKSHLGRKKIAHFCVRGFSVTPCRRSWRGFGRPLALLSLRSSDLERSLCYTLL